MTLVNVQLSCRSHTPNKLHLTWEKKRDIWMASASELFSQDSALAFTVAAVAFSLLSRRFYGVQPLNPHWCCLFRPIHSAAYPPNRAGIIESVDSLVVFQFVFPLTILFLKYLIRLCNFVVILHDYLMSSGKTSGANFTYCDMALWWVSHKNNSLSFFKFNFCLLFA